MPDTPQSGTTAYEQVEVTYYVGGLAARTAIKTRASPSEAAAMDAAGATRDPYDALDPETRRRYEAQDAWASEHLRPWRNQGA